MAPKLINLVENPLASRSTSIPNCFNICRGVLSPPQSKSGMTWTKKRDQSINWDLKIAVRDEGHLLRTGWREAGGVLVVILGGAQNVLFKKR